MLADDATATAEHNNEIHLRKDATENERRKHRNLKIIKRTKIYILMKGNETTKAVYFDEFKFKGYDTRITKFCDMLNEFMARLNKDGFLHVAVDMELGRDIFKGGGQKIMDGYKKHITPFIEQQNELMRGVAVENAKKRESELLKMIQEFSEDSYKVFNSYNGFYSLHTAFDVIRHDSSDNQFKEDQDELKELCTLYLDGDALALYERVKKCFEEIQAIDEECRRLNPAKDQREATPFITNNNGYGLLSSDAYGKIETHYERFAFLK